MNNPICIRCGGEIVGSAHLKDMHRHCAEAAIFEQKHSKAATDALLTRRDFLKDRFTYDETPICAKDMCPPGDGETEATHV